MKKTSPDSHSHTLDEIAKLAGTSKSTVSRVITNDPRISEKTRARVMQVVDKLHYRPNLFARALAGGKTGLIGVISSNIGSGFYAEVIRGIDLVFNRLGKRLLVSFAHYEADYEALWQDIVLGGRVEGLVVVAPTSDFFKIKPDIADIPTVLCVGNPPKEDVHWQKVDRVGMNNAQGMNELVAQLAAQGCRTMLHAAGWSNNFDAMERKKYFVKACRTHKVKSEVEEFGITPSDGRTSMEIYLKKSKQLPDAIVCFNDSIAVGILEAWNGFAGTKRPPPFALTGWDDSPTAAIVGLTSVSIPFDRLGEESALLLNQRISGQSTSGMQQRLIDLSIIQRTSSQFKQPASRER